MPLAPLPLLLWLVSVASAQPIGPPEPPEVFALDALAPEFATLTWRAQPDTVYRLCVTRDRARHDPYACFLAGGEGDTAVGIPDQDGDQYLLSLQACRAEESDCSVPVDAGAVGRRVGGGFDFYATAWLRPDGSAYLTSYSRVSGASLVYHQARPGLADQARRGCFQFGEGACGAETLPLPGAFAGITQQVPRVGTAALTFELRARPHAALMFDDGTGLFTGGRYSVQVVLDEYGVKGNFFLIGRAMRDYPGAVRALVAAGHRVGNHTWSHPFLWNLTNDQIAQEITLAEQQYRAVVGGGTTKPCFRAPNGAIDRRVASVVASLGYRQIDWTASGEDWRGIPAALIVRNVLRDLGDGALISLHTQEAQTLIALRSLIPLMQSWGYVFDIVC